MMKKIIFFLLLAEVGMLTGHPLRAQEAATKLQQTEESLMADSLKNDSLNWRIMLRLADLYQEKNRTRRAEVLLEKALALHPSDSVKRSLAKCYYARGYYQKSIDLCNEMMQQDTIDVDLSMLARCYERMGLADSTIKYRQIIAERDLEDYGNIQSLARIFNQVGMNEMALHYLDLYYNVDSTNLTVNNQRAYILHELREFDEAIEEYRKLREQGFLNATSLYYDGVAHSRIGKRKEAYELLEEARRRSIVPNGYIYAELGMVSDDVGKEKEGIEHINTAMRLLLPDSALMYSLFDAKAMSEMALFRYRDALESYKRSLDYQMNLTNICQIAYIYGTLKDEQNERRYYEMFLRELEKVRRPERYASLKQRAERRLRYLNEERFFRGEGVPNQTQQNR